ncbi:MAG: plasmid pRiA4b ORF-3 family protein [Dehalococcoidales bacterium]|nr:MAG: plasmid pRiA4b ORF-3 family protein [Dehalococcoidales bacterium]
MLYEIKIQLRGIKPSIWRTIRISPQTSLPKLHRIIQKTMGWTNSHLHLFEIDEVLYGDGEFDWDLDINDYRGLSINRIFNERRKSFVYEYDLGDSWKHDITLLYTIAGKPEEKITCVAGERACPPEDCGGVPGYYNLLRILSDPSDEDYDEMLEWVGGKYDPAYFDVSATDRVLKRIR